MEAWSPWARPRGSALVTCRVTVVPSRQRSSGAGSEPLTVIAGRVRPVKLTMDWPMVRWNRVPDSSGIAGTAGSRVRPRDGARPAAVTTPPAARPWTNRRRDVGTGYGRMGGRQARGRDRYGILPCPPRIPWPVRVQIPGCDHGDRGTVRFIRTHATPEL